MATYDVWIYKRSQLSLHYYGQSRAHDTASQLLPTGMMIKVDRVRWENFMFGHLVDSIFVNDW